MANEKIKKNDFIEIEFTGKITSTGEVFDTNVLEEAKKAKFETKNIKPFIMAIGHKMLPEGFDKDLENKELNKAYTTDLSPEKTFGKRNPQMVKMVATKLFHEQKINPERGMQLNLDGQLVKILSSSGGRTLVDFNNPLAGKDITYTYKILREVTDENEKVNALQDFLFRKQLDFEIVEDKIIFNVEKKIEPLVKMFSEKFKEILGKEIETKIIEEKKKEEKTLKKSQVGKRGKERAEEKKEDDKKKEVKNTTQSQ
ncbi:MAG: FKBP-type peptidyl-prolyl cis-trans isomerase [archaeon]